MSRPEEKNEVKETKQTRAVVDLESVDFARAPWTEVDAAVVGYDANQSSRDYWLGKGLLHIEEREIFRDAGFRSLASYCESRLGWDPHTTAERRRTALALESLPLLSAELREGRIRWSAVREITRVADGSAESTWIEFARGKTVHQIAMHVKVRRPGDTPQAPADPALFRQVLRFECDGEEYAVITGVIAQVRAALGEAGRELSEAQCLKLALEEKIASYQVQATFCPGCLAAGMRSRSEVVPITASTVEKLMCESQIVGADGKIASRHIPADVERAAMIRAGGTCEVPACRARWYLHTHHVRLVSEGGTHALANLMVLCGMHHMLLHSGIVWIEGSRHDGFRFLHADGTRLGDVPNQSRAEAFQTAFQALRDGGIPEGRVREALTRVREQGSCTTVEEIVAQASKALVDDLRSESSSGGDDVAAERTATYAVRGAFDWASHVGRNAGDRATEEFLQ